jgi:hypothetical protein
MLQTLYINTKIDAEIVLQSGLNAATRYLIRVRDYAHQGECRDRRRAIRCSVLKLKRARDTNRLFTDRLQPFSFSQKGT